MSFGGFFALLLFLAIFSAFLEPTSSEPIETHVSDDDIIPLAFIAHEEFCGGD